MRISRYSSSAPSIEICAFSGSPGCNGFMTLSTVAGNVTLGFSSEFAEPSPIATPPCKVIERPTTCASVSAFLRDLQFRSLYATAHRKAHLMVSIRLRIWRRPAFALNQFARCHPHFSVLFVRRYPARLAKPAAIGTYASPLVFLFDLFTLPASPRPRSST